MVRRVRTPLTKALLRIEELERVYRWQDSVLAFMETPNADITNVDTSKVYQLRSDGKGADTFLQRGETVRIRSQPNLLFLAKYMHRENFRSEVYYGLTLYGVRNASKVYWFKHDNILERNIQVTSDEQLLYKN